MKLIKAYLPSLCSFMSFFLILFAQTSFSIETSSFPKHFSGAKKGDKIKELAQVRQYLIKYGYMNSVSSGHQLQEDFDYNLEQSIKKYQSFNHLDSSGILDERTLAQMAMPRCGMPDFVKGMKQLVLRSNGSYYALESSKWSKFDLNWAIKPDTPSVATRPIVGAFGKWMSVSKFRFTPSSLFDSSDLQISFIKIGDGPGKHLANAGQPPSGELHFDADEKWADGAVDGAFDIGSVALHEIGHLLGLDHSNVQSAIMWPSFKRGVTKGLDADDIAGIRAMYP